MKACTMYHLPEGEVTMKSKFVENPGEMAELEAAGWSADPAVFEPQAPEAAAPEAAAPEAAAPEAAAPEAAAPEAGK